MTTSADALAALRAETVRVHKTTAAKQFLNRNPRNANVGTRSPHPRPCPPRNPEPNRVVTSCHTSMGAPAGAGYETTADAAVATIRVMATERGTGNSFVKYQQS